MLDVDRQMTGEELKRMQELAAKGNLSRDRTLETSDQDAWPDDFELIRMDDVAEMQLLLSRAADELARLYGRSDPPA